MNGLSSINVTTKGAVLLGESVSCDGFRIDRPYRVQSHTHQDHMRDFSNSKGNQIILMSKWTRELLITEFNADLPYRIDVIGLDLSTAHFYGDLKVQLEPSGHTLDAVQVQVEYPDGRRLGYSGDFAWPIRPVIQVDSLVVDSTNGDPEYRRKYTQDDADDAFREKIIMHAYSGPIVIKAHRGTLERAAALLSQVYKQPVLSNRATQKDFDVYRAAGYPICETVDVESEEGKKILKTNQYVSLQPSQTQTLFPFKVENCTTIILSSVMVNPSNPVREHPEIGRQKSYQIAMSNHADFDGTIAYIEATGAQQVVTDHRGGRAHQLAGYIKERLGIESWPADLIKDNNWGY